jgi:hypothetical protein
MEKQTKKVLLIIVLIVFGLFGFYKISSILAAGSYPFAEIYELNASEEVVIRAIDKFKVKHPEYIVPNVTIQNEGSFNLSESEGRKDSSYWYFVYFYYPKENQILLTWTRPNNEGGTSLAFVSINDGLELGHWKEINNDFWFLENRKLKKQFNERIVNEIQSTLYQNL